MAKNLGKDRCNKTIYQIFPPKKVIILLKNTFHRHICYKNLVPSSIFATNSLRKVTACPPRNRRGHDSIVACPLAFLEGYAAVVACPLTFFGGYAAIAACPLAFLGGYAAVVACPLAFLGGYAAVVACPLAFLGGYAAIAACPLAFLGGYAAVVACPLTFFGGYAAVAACPLAFLKGYTRIVACPPRIREGHATKRNRLFWLRTARPRSRMIFRSLRMMTLFAAKGIAIRMLLFKDITHEQYPLRQRRRNAGVPNRPEKGARA